MGIEIIRIEHGCSPDFWKWIGCASLNERVAKELGDHLKSSTGQIWWLAIKNNVCVGFCTMRCNKGYIYLCHDYVYPFARNRGIYKQLFHARLRYILDTFGSNQTITAVVTKSALPMYEALCFSIIKQTKNFTHVCLKSSSPAVSSF